MSRFKDAAFQCLLRTTKHYPEIHESSEMFREHNRNVLVIDTHFLGTPFVSELWKPELHFSGKHFSVGSVLEAEIAAQFLDSAP